MHKKILSLLTAVTMLTGYALPAFAEEVSLPDDGQISDFLTETADDDINGFQDDDTATEDTEADVTADEPSDEASEADDTAFDEETAEDGETSDTAEDTDVPEDVQADVTEAVTDETAVDDEDTVDITEDTAGADDETSDQDAQTPAEDEQDEEIISEETAEATDEDTDSEETLEEDELDVYVNGEVRISATTFPDPIFRSYVLSTFDLDGNGSLNQYEIDRARNVKVEGMGIKTLAGIEYLEELSGIYASDNLLTSLDTSQNKKINGIWVANNNFTSLDFTSSPSLEWLYCFDCPNLRSINISNNERMAYLECSDCPLGKLDVSHNPNLEHLICASCALTSLDLSNNPNLQHLDAFNNGNSPLGRDDPLNNKLTKLDLSHNTKMKRLNIWANYDLKFVDISVCPGLQEYNCAMIGATYVDVRHNPELDKLMINYNSIKNIDLSHNPKLTKLYAECNQLTELDISHNPNLHFLQVFTNPFTKLNIGNNRFLMQTYKEGRKADESAVGQCHSWTLDEFTGDDSTGNDDIYFLCFDDKVTLSMTATNTNVNTDVNDYAGDPYVSNPELLISREEVIQQLYELAGSPRVTLTKSKYTDVQKGAWYEQALLWGEQNNITTGCPDISDKTFGVGKWMRRQDLALTLMRYAEYKHYLRAIDFGRSDDFMDYYDIDSYAWEAVCWACTYNIMIGKGADGAPKSQRRIDPHGRATRKEFQDMVNRMLEKNDVSSSSVTVSGKPVLTLTAGNGSVTLKWTQVSNTTSYKVYRYENGQYNFLKETTATTYTDTGLTNGKRYGYLVRAFLSTKGSAYSVNDVKYATPTGPGSTVTVAKPSFTLTAGNSSAVIKWNAVSGATSYRVYRVDNGTYTALTTTTGTSYTASGLKNGTKYGFLVRAFKGDTGSAYTTSDIKYVTPVYSLAKPSFTVTAGNTSAVIKWNAVSGATSYRVYRVSGSTYTYLTTTTGTSYTATGLKNGTKYGFLVRAFKGDTGSAYTASDVKYVTPAVTLAKPSFTVTAGNSSAVITWTKVSGAAQYRIYRVDNGTYTAIANSTGTSYTATGLKNGTKYGFLVRAINGSTGSAYTASDVKYVTPQYTVAKPVISVLPANNGALILWDRVAGATSYRIYRYNNGTYTLVETTTIPGYTVIGLTNGTKYGFLVRAFNGNNGSAYSAADVKYVIPRFIPDAPTVTATAGTKQAVLKWNAVPGATSYRVYRYSNGTYTPLVNVTGTSYTATGLTSGTKYGFLVRAFYNDEGSDYTTADVKYVTVK